MDLKSRSVAVIGGGVSGVVSALHLKNEGMNVVVFERSDAVGGVWRYDARRPLELKYPTTQPLEEILDDVKVPVTGEVIVEVSPNEKETIKLLHAPPSPCYEGLMNNVSTPLMEIKNQEWPLGTPDFVSHEVLGAYVQQVPVRGSLEDSIRLNTRVSRLWKEGSVWKIESTELKDLGNDKLKKVKRVDEFDAVIVASGHYDLPNIPDIPGLKEWKQSFPERVQHSKGYRKPGDFARQNVLLIGGGVSSADIAKELGPVAKRVIQSTRGAKRDLPAEWLPANGRRVGSIRSFDLEQEPHSNSSAIPGTVILADGTILEDIDQVVICTGYHMSFPFLRDLHDTTKGAGSASDDENVLVTDGTQTHNLHKDIFYIPDPSLIFVGIPYYTATFSLFEIQNIAVSKVLAGKAELPSRAAMREEYLQRLKAKGSGRDFHDLMGKEIEYALDLVGWINKEGERLGLEAIEGHTAKWHEAYERRLSEKPEQLRFA